MSNGSYSSTGEDPTHAIDNDPGTKYLNYGSGGFSVVVGWEPGVATGFYVTPNITDASVACGLLFATGNDHTERDPLTVTLEGTNATGALLHIGSSWSLLYNGSTGMLPMSLSRSTFAPQQNFSNTVAFQSY